MSGQDKTASGRLTVPIRIRLAKWVALVMLQGASAMFFIGDVWTEFMDAGFVAHTVLEGTATIALIFGVVLGGFEVYRISRIATEAGESLKRARAEFSDLIHQRFAQWSLTSAEAEIALLLLKGFDIAEIAEFRRTAQGTVRAQLSRIYEKSGHPSRGRFVSSFLDILIDTPANEA